jgi:nucleolar complex protein 3
MAYEAAPRKRRPSWDSEEGHAIPRLPIKLADGRIQKTSGQTLARTTTIDREDDGGDESEDVESYESHRVEDVAIGARFGRPAVVDVIGNKSRKARIQGAKDQIAEICQEIVAEPENSVRAFFQWF